MKNHHYIFLVPHLTVIKKLVPSSEPGKNPASHLTKWKKNLVPTFSVNKGDTAPKAQKKNLVSPFDLMKKSGLPL